MNAQSGNGIVTIQLDVDPGDTLLIAISTLQQHTLNGNCNTAPGQCAGTMNFAVTDTFNNKLLLDVDSWTTAGVILGDQDTVIWGTGPSRARAPRRGGVDTVTIAAVSTGPIQCSHTAGCYDGGQTSTDARGHYVVCGSTYSGVKSISSGAFKMGSKACINGLCGPLISSTIVLQTSLDRAVIIYGSDNKPSVLPGAPLNSTYTPLPSCNLSEGCVNPGQQQTYPNCVLDSRGMLTEVRETLQASGSVSSLNGQSPAELCWVDVTSENSGLVTSSIDWFAQDNADVSYLILR